MPERSRFKTPLESQWVRGLQSLLKSPQQHFHANFPLRQDKLR